MRGVLPSIKCDKKRQKIKNSNQTVIYSGHVLGDYYIQILNVIGRVHVSISSIYLWTDNARLT